MFSAMTLVGCVLLTLALAVYMGSTEGNAIEFIALLVICQGTWILLLITCVQRVLQLRSGW